MPDGQGGIEKRHHSSHWGAFRAHVRDGRMVGFEPFAKGTGALPHPGIHSGTPYTTKTRISQPMIRAGWLEGGPRQEHRWTRRRTFRARLLGFCP